MKKTKAKWMIYLEYFGFLLLYKVVHAVPFKKVGS